MKATILDTKTGITNTLNASFYELAEGNFSCDCNRNFWRIDQGNRCVGSKRFIVVKIEKENNDEPDCCLSEVNEDYPKELLLKHGISA